MTEPTRREKIEAMLVDEPNDPFLRYALALELEKEAQHERSLELLRGLMADTPPHVPSFLMAAQHLANQARVDDAREVLREGIDVARAAGEQHAAAEMSDLLASLGEL